MSERKNTPTPWVAEPNAKSGFIAIRGKRLDGVVRLSDGHGLVVIVDASVGCDSMFPSTNKEDEANAALIVEAVNSYADLKAEVATLRASNAELVEATMQRPIEEAPKDGTCIIAPVGHGFWDVLSFWDGAWRETANGLRAKEQPKVFLSLSKLLALPVAAALSKTERNAQDGSHHAAEQSS